MLYNVYNFKNVSISISVLVYELVKIKNSCLKISKRLNYRYSKPSKRPNTTITPFPR